MYWETYNSMTRGMNRAYRRTANGRSVVAKAHAVALQQKTDCLQRVAWSMLRAKPAVDMLAVLDAFDRAPQACHGAEKAPATASSPTACAKQYDPDLHFSPARRGFK